MHASCVTRTRRTSGQLRNCESGQASRRGAWRTERRAMRNPMFVSTHIAVLTAILGLFVVAPPAVAQQQERCRVLCAPELKIEPTFTIENLFRPPVIETIEDGRVVDSAREEREAVFEIIFALEVPTQIPRIGL